MTTDMCSLEVYRTLNGERKLARLSVEFVFKEEPTRDQVDSFSKWMMNKFRGCEVNEVVHGEPTNAAIAHVLEAVCSTFFVGSNDVEVTVTER